MNAYELANKLENKDRLWSIDEKLMLNTCKMLRQQADRIAELEKSQMAWYEAGKFVTPQIKQLSDEELNKAFDYYCETDEGVLRFNYELRDEWKKEQLIRWKEALKKASEK